MGKELTISIAAYNVEKYIAEALDSCIVEDVMDDLEVIVIIDGATDGTAEIADQYAEKYPAVFKVIKKENGGYGTTVNAGIQNATGRYFKLLDGDDWLDRDGLRQLIKHIKNTDADCLIHRLYRVTDETKEYITHEPEWKDYEGQTLFTNEIHEPICTGMWQMTVRTELLKKEQYLLPKHTLYTDQLFVINAMTRTKKVFFSDIPVYCYRIGRDGQSVSKENRIKHYQETIEVFLRQVDLYNTSAFMNDDNRNFVLSRAGRYYFFVIRTMLLMPYSQKVKNELIQLEKTVKRQAPDIYKYAEQTSRKVKLLRMTKYTAYRLLAGKEKNWF